MKILTLVFFVILTSKPIKSEDYIPDEVTAIKIAEAIWLPIYGNKVLDKKPFRASLSKDKCNWIVKGSVPKGELGGYPIIEIRKSDSKVIRVFHTK